jgi:hypothetical protein
MIWGAVQSGVDVMERGYEGGEQQGGAEADTEGHDRAAHVPGRHRAARPRGARDVYGASLGQSMCVLRFNVRRCCWSIFTRRKAFSAKVSRFRAAKLLECEPRSNAEPKPNPYSRK